MIPTRVHGYLDYLLALILIAAPWLFGFNRGGAETYVFVVIGMAVLLMSLFTDYELGALKAIPMSVHLTMDILAGLLLLASPWLLGFAEYVTTPHVVFGLIEAGTALMTSRRPAEARTNMHR